VTPTGRASPTSTPSSPPKPELSTILAAYREQLTLKSSTSPERDSAAAFAAVPEAVMGVMTTRARSRRARLQGAEQAQLLAPHLLRDYPERPGKSYPVEFDQVHSWRQYSAMTPLPQFAHRGKRWATSTSSRIRRDAAPPAALRQARGPGAAAALRAQTAALYFKGKVERRGTQTSEAWSAPASARASRSRAWCRSLRASPTR